jgi:UDP:flavonoid glycosyltransferase YjiC (YdhE family)
MKIVLATFGSLGDMHPMNALGIELRRRNHKVVFAAMEAYREKINALGFEFRPMRPDVNPDDREFARRVMDAKTGTELLLKEILLPSVRVQYEDLTNAIEDADLLVTGEVVYAAKSVVEKTGINWITTSLAPASFLSAHDPFLPPTAQWLQYFRFLGAGFHGIMYGMIRRLVKTWLGDYRKFRNELGLDENHDPVFDDKFSSLLHLALFSKVLGKPQPDWHRPTLQCGFCFYDGKDDLGKMPEKLAEFMEAENDPPIVFTLGSAAVMDARDFFEESAKAARMLGKRAVLLYGVFNEPPKETDERIVAFDYAPYSFVFPKAACVVHQGGVGTTAQVLRAGVPHLIMPYSHDQPDNAARCVRAGVARTISRERYTAESAARELSEILSKKSYKETAVEASRTVKSELGTETACDAIENIMNSKAAAIRAEKNDLSAGAKSLGEY